MSSPPGTLTLTAVSGVAGAGVGATPVLAAVAGRGAGIPGTGGPARGAVTTFVVPRLGRGRGDNRFVVVAAALAVAAVGLVAAPAIFVAAAARLVAADARFVAAAARLVADPFAGAPRNGNCARAAAGFVASFSSRIARDGT